MAAQAAMPERLCLENVIDAAHLGGAAAFSLSALFIQRRRLAVLAEFVRTIRK